MGVKTKPSVKQVTKLHLEMHIKILRKLKMLLFLCLNAHSHMQHDYSVDSTNAAEFVSQIVC